MRTLGRTISWLAVVTVVVLAAVAGTFGAVTGRAPRAITAPPSAARIVSLAFLGADDGYGLFQEADRASCSLAVARSDDGGTTFSSPVALAGSSCASAGGPSATSVSFDDHGDGFVFDPGLFVTHDGGSTWSDVSSFGPVRRVVAVGDSVWALHGSCATRATTVCSYGIEESSDGGETWSDHPLPRAGSATSYTDLVRTSATSALLVAASLGVPKVGQAPNDAVTILSTIDRGEHWRTVSSAPCAGRGWTIDLSRAPDGALWLVCGGQPGAGNQLKSFARSLDGGRTWVQGPCAVQLPVGRFVDCLVSHQMLGGYLGDLVALSATTAFIDGGRSFLQVSRDGGRTWSRTVPALGDGDLAVGGLSFAGQQAGWVIDGVGNPDATLWRTTDGGRSWAEAWSPRR
ncbi:MAG: hypothetical protein ACYCU7_10455 [Acidimicrobiales bacterium]